MATDTIPAMPPGPPEPPVTGAATGSGDSPVQSWMASLIEPVPPARPASGSGAGDPAADEATHTAPGATSESFHDVREVAEEDATGEKRKAQGSIWKAWWLAGAQRWAKGGGTANKRLDAAKAKAQAHQVKEARTTTVNKSGGLTPRGASGATGAGGGSGGKGSMKSPNRGSGNSSKNSSGGNSGGTSGRGGSGSGGSSGRGPGGSGGSGSGSKGSSGDGAGGGSTKQPKGSGSGSKGASGKDASGSGSAGSKGAAGGDSRSKGSSGAGGKSPKGSGSSDKGAKSSGSAGGSGSPGGSGASGKQGGTGSKGKDGAAGKADKGTKAKDAGASSGSAGTDGRTPLQKSRETGHKDGGAVREVVDHVKAYKDGARDGYRDKKAANGKEHDRLDKAHTESKKKADQLRKQDDPEKKQQGQKVIGPDGRPVTLLPPDKEDDGVSTSIKPLAVQDIDANALTLGTDASSGTISRGELRNFKQYERKLEAKENHLIKIHEACKQLAKQAEEEAKECQTLAEDAKSVKGGEKVGEKLTKLADAAKAQAVEAEELAKQAQRAAEMCKVVLTNIQTRYAPLYKAVVDSDETKPAELRFYTDKGNYAAAA